MSKPTLAFDSTRPAQRCEKPKSNARLSSGYPVICREISAKIGDLPSFLQGEMTGYVGAREVILVRQLKSFGIPGFSVPFHDRVSMLVEMVGGLVVAAKIAKVDRDTVNNWRKEGARVPILGVLPLAIEAKVTLDWVATGYQQRPDIEALGWNLGMDESGADAGPAPGFTQLLPLRPDIVSEGGNARVERWVPSDVAVSAAWLSNLFDLTDETARYAVLEEGGLAPLLPAGTFVILDTRPNQNLRSGLYLLEAGEELLPRRLYVGPDGRLELVADADPNWRFNVTPPRMDLHRIVWSARIH